MRWLRGQPAALKAFAAAFVGQVLLTAAHTLASPSSLLTNISMTFETDDPMAFLPGIIGVRLLVAGTIIGFVYFRASQIAKWAAAILAGSRIFQVPNAWIGLKIADPDSIVWTLETFLGLIAVGCLFLPQARAWFASKGRTVADDRAVFE